MTRRVPEDRFTNTPEDAAKYERWRAEAQGEIPDPAFEADPDEWPSPRDDEPEGGEE